MLPVIGIIICILLIIFMILLLFYSDNLYSTLKKDIWLECDVIIFLMIGVSLSLVVIADLCDLKNNFNLVPLLLAIMILEFLWILMLKSRNFFTSIAIATIIAGFMSINTLLLSVSKNKELVFLMLPFLFLSFIQIIMSDDIFKNNIDKDEINRCKHNC